MKHILGLLVLFLAAVTAHAQAVPTRATPDEIDHWLRSGDPRMVAWGASYATSTGNTAELPVLAALAESYQAAPAQQFDSKGMYLPRTPEQEQRLDSMQAVLDALIQLHGAVHFEAVTAVLPDFPAQALTLFATMPEPERSQRAAALYATRDPPDKPYDWHQYARQQMIHMAAAILAFNPLPGFTATLLNETTVILKISVRDDDSKPGVGFGAAACGDSGALAPAPGWPQPYTYVVEQQWIDQQLKDTVLIPGKPAITTRRALSSSTCSALQSLTSRERLALVQLEAGPSASHVGISVLQYDSLRYPGAAGYLAALTTLIEQHKAPFQALANALIARSFLTAAEATTAVPTFSVEIEDERQDKTQALPSLPSLDPHVLITAPGTPPNRN